MFPPSLSTMLIFWILSIFMHESIHALTKCGGDTRGDGMCNHDQTHRVCAKIGDPESTFWEFTGQRSWCGTSYYDDDPIRFNTDTYKQIRCPVEEPTWCICKWATEKWINQIHGGCDSVEIDCKATDVIEEYDIKRMFLID